MAESLPLVLAGPIVRRVEPTGCSFWIALSKKASVVAKVWEQVHLAGATPGTVAGGDGPYASSSPTDLQQFGTNLYAGVITIDLSKPETPDLQPGRIYSYDLVTTIDGAEQGLKQMRLLEDEEDLPGDERLPGVDSTAPLQKALGYMPGRLPSFMTLHHQVDKLRFAHASCRKPHGPVTDAMQFLDQRLDLDFNDVDKRVQQLVLTGDQIYADDVATCFIPMLNQLGLDLLGAGREEQLPINEDKKFTATIGNFPAMRRSWLVRETARFTSTSSENHLLSFGEYAAMYLAAWCPRVWRKLAEEDEVFVGPPLDPDLQEALNHIEKCYKPEGGDFPSVIAKWKSKRLKSYQNGLKSLEEFRKAVPFAARALANVSTLMIFDDHEITDDWNLNKRWRNRVYSTPLGKTIIRNGMMAYGIFQAWGNDPAAFKKGNNKLFLSETRKVLGTNADTPANTVPAASVDKLDELVGSTEAANGKRASWNYRVPGPIHLTCVLDTRTRRTFKGQGFAPPNLLGSTLNSQVPKGPMTDGRELLVVISPVPVLGPHLIEEIGTPLYEIYGDYNFARKFKEDRSKHECDPNASEVGAEKADAESWSADEPAREKLLARLATHGKAVILSGDVHYAVSLRLDYWKGTTASSIPIVQLTASPARNNFKGFVEALLRQNALLQLYQEGTPPETLAWEKANPLELPDGVFISAGRRGRMRREPVLLPSRGWPAGTAFKPGKEPDWRWRLQLFQDIRPQSEFPADGPSPPQLGTPDLDPSNKDTVVQRYRELAARHQLASNPDSFLLLRRMVFTPNIGIVELITEEETLHVRHTLLSKSASDPKKGLANTVHTISLAPTPDAVPELQIKE